MVFPCREVIFSMVSSHPGPAAAAAKAPAAAGGKGSQNSQQQQEEKKKPKSSFSLADDFFQACFPAESFHAESY